MSVSDAPLLVSSFAASPVEPLSTALKAAPVPRPDNESKFKTRSWTLIRFWLSLWEKGFASRDDAELFSPVGVRGRTSELEATSLRMKLLAALWVSPCTALAP